MHHGGATGGRGRRGHSGTPGQKREIEQTEFFAVKLTVLSVFRRCTSTPRLPATCKTSRRKGRLRIGLMHTKDASRTGAACIPAEAPAHVIRRSNAGQLRSRPVAASARSAFDGDTDQRSLAGRVTRDLALDRVDVCLNPRNRLPQFCTPALLLCAGTRVSCCGRVQL